MIRAARPSYTLAAVVCGALIAVALVTDTARAERPRVYAITHARIVTAPGKVIDDGTLLIRDDVIQAVGAKVTVPPDAEVIEAQKGWSVYPAFIDAASSVGLESEDAAARGGGAPEQGKGPAPVVGAHHELKSIHPETAVLDQIDPAHASIARHRAMGFAVANVLPAKGVFRGESAILTLRAGPARSIVVKDRFAEVVALETQSFMGRQYPSSRMGAMAAVRQAFLDATRDGEWSRRYAANPAGMAPPEYRSSDVPLQEVLARERPVIFVAVTALDPGRFASLAAEFNLDAMTMLRGLADRPEDIGEKGMPLLLPLELPEKADTKDEDAMLDTTLEQMQASVGAPRLPKTLDGGRKLAFVTAGMKDPKKFPENLAAVVKAGLDPARALAALTTTPAELLGVTRIMGTVEAGKLANVIVVDGELFTDKPVLRHLFVQGYHEKIDPDKKPDDKPGRPSPMQDEDVDLEAFQ